MFVLTGFSLQVFDRGVDSWETEFEIFQMEGGIVAVAISLTCNSWNTVQQDEAVPT